jgi:hypothetical protein
LPANSLAARKRILQFPRRSSLPHRVTAALLHKRRYGRH